MTDARHLPADLLAAGRAVDTSEASRSLSQHHLSLAEIISTVGSSLDLAEVLRSVVRLLSEASAVHACFVYFIEDDGSRLVLRAASDPYVEHAGRVSLPRGEGLAWWVAERQEPAFIRENAQDDPRVSYVPELDAGGFSSMISVPVLARDRTTIGVISLHTEPPREFTDEDLRFLTASASVVASAIENARLYEESLKRVAELEELAQLGSIIARTESFEELLPAMASCTLGVLGAQSFSIYLLDRGVDTLELFGSFPSETEATTTIASRDIGPEVTHIGGTPRVRVPIVAGEHLVGVLEACGTSRLEIARTIANQIAVVSKKIELIERLTERNLIKDFFEELASGEVSPSLTQRASRLGCQLDDEYVVLMASPSSVNLEEILASVLPDSLFDRREEYLRALVRVPPAGLERLLLRVRAAHAQCAEPLVIGLSNICFGAAGFAVGFEEARHALLGATVFTGNPGVMSYDDLGVYKYLLRMSLDGTIREPHLDAVRAIRAYDGERRASLLQTLDELLHRQGNVQSTAKALCIHPNTLRQRLRRMSAISGLDLAKADRLMIELAVKIVKLQQPSATRPFEQTRP